MASQGPNSPSSGTDDSSVGTLAWTNPGNITSSNNNYATASCSASVVTHYVVGTNYGFSVTSGATIDGIVVEVERSQSSVGGSIADNRVRIVKGGTIGSTDKAAAGTWPTTDLYQTYGSSSDLWGETWTDTDINATTFGAALSAKESTGGGTAVARVDHIRITVYYTVSFDPSTGFPWAAKSFVQTRVFKAMAAALLVPDLSQLNPFDASQQPTVTVGVSKRGPAGQGGRAYAGIMEPTIWSPFDPATNDPGVYVGKSDRKPQPLTRYAVSDLDSSTFVTFDVATTPRTVYGKSDRLPPGRGGRAYMGPIEPTTYTPWKIDYLQAGQTPGQRGRQPYPLVSVYWPDLYPIDAPVITDWGLTPTGKAVPPLRRAPFSGFAISWERSVTVLPPSVGVTVPRPRQSPQVRVSGPITTDYVGRSIAAVAGWNRAVKAGNGRAWQTLGVASRSGRSIDPIIFPNVEMGRPWLIRANRPVTRSRPEPFTRFAFIDSPQNPIPWVLSSGIKQRAKVAGFNRVAAVRFESSGLVPVVRGVQPAVRRIVRAMTPTPILETLTTGIVPILLRPVVGRNILALRRPAGPSSRVAFVSADWSTYYRQDDRDASGGGGYGQTSGGGGGYNSSSSGTWSRS